jgi:hypothetical protein
MQMQTDKVAYTTIDDPSAYFQTALYTGNGTSTNAITNDGNSDLQPDWLWLKARSIVADHIIFDSTRGTNKRISTNTTSAEETQAFYSSFDSDGFTLGDSNANVNQNGTTYVTWQWKANGGTTSSNTDGSITSTVQANTTAGFSIVTYTGTGSNATVGHGLGSAPNWLIVKSRGNADPWNNLVDDIGADETLEFNTFNMGTGVWNTTRPTSTVFSIGTNNGVNRSSGTFVAYCFAEKQGYSKFGKYVGNGDATNGPFVYTGFKPSWIMQKNISSNGNDWYMWDVKRALDSQGYVNRNDKYLQANSTGVQSTGAGFDFLSNGFRPVSTNAGYINTSGSTYIYFAFAEHPFVSSKGVPTTAR